MGVEALETAVNTVELQIERQSQEKPNAGRKLEVCKCRYHCGGTVRVLLRSGDYWDEMQVWFSAAAESGEPSPPQSHRLGRKQNMGRGGGGEGGRRKTLEGRGWNPDTLPVA